MGSMMEEPGQYVMAVLPNRLYDYYGACSGIWRKTSMP